MKKKILILVIIVVISLVCGFCINYFSKPVEPVDDNSITVIGTIMDITDNMASIKPQDKEVTTELDYIKFYLPEGEENSWVVGDIVKVKYLYGHITEKNVIELVSLESVGKERLFNSANSVPVSNAEHRGNGTVFKSFFAYDNSIVLDTFSIQDEFYYKKIISYAEYEKYKKLIPELRTLTENDFINYYLVIAMSKDIDYIYMLNDVESEDDSVTLEILKNKTLSEPSQVPTFSGVSVILPNVTEVPTENIKLYIKNQ